MVARAQDVHERVVGHTLSLLDPLGRVERPMDTEADPAPAGFFLRLRQRGEALPVEPPDIPSIIFCHALSSLETKVNGMRSG